MSKFLGSFLAVAFLLSSSNNAMVGAFVPPSSASTRQSTTSLGLRSDQEMFDTQTLANGQYPGGRNVDGGYSVGGRGYYPSYSRGGSLYYPGGGYGNRGTSYISGPSYGYNNGMGYDYGYSGYGGFYGGTVQGESRRTFSTSGTDSSTVQLETDGRPLNANVEVWQGPGNNPAKMRLYSEDGYLRPWVAGFANTPRGGYSTSLSVNNEANVAFPLRANMMGDRNYNSRSYGGYGNGGGYGYGMGGGYGMMGGGDGGYVGSSRRSAINVDGGALKTFSFPPGVQAVVVEIWSEDFPCYADVELWDGPNAVKQAAEIYTDSGYDRPWSAIIENPRFDSATIAVRNVGPLEFPLKVCVEPMY